MNFKDLSQQLLPILLSLCTEWFPNGKKRGNEYKVGGLDGKRGDSLSINLRTGVWKDFATGETGGDPISLYAAARGLSQSDAAKALGGRQATAAPAPPELGDDWEPLSKLPDEDEMTAPKLFAGWTHHAYRRANGQIYGYIQRSPDKRICPLSWCIDSRGDQAWRQKAFSKPRPLYGLETLKRAKTVIIVEGEKCADYLRAHCPVPVLTWPGGSNATQHVDWSPLKGRRVIIWPDNDAPGRKAAEAIREQIPTAEILIPPTSKPEGWDCADWTPEDGDITKFLPLETPPTVTAVTIAQPEVAVTFERGEVGNGAWQDYGIRVSKNGVPIVNLATIQHILAEHPHWKGRIWWDEFLEQILFQTESGVVPWVDQHDRKTLIWIQNVFELYNAGKQDVQDAVKTIAHTNKRNELTDWLGALKWDGTPRVRQLFTRGFGARDTEFSAQVSKCWLVSAVARATRPGCKVDTLPILEGSQGAGKSSGLKIIGGQWFSEIHADISEKDFLLQMKGKWILEISEMHALTRSEVAKVKGILSNCCDRYRIPYEAHATDHPRRSVFAGTTNRDDWQIDSTGARRFWPVRCGRIDRDWLEASREQLFAEALHLLNAGETWYDVCVETAAQETAQREPTDTWKDVLFSKLNPGEHYTSVELLADVFQLPLKDQDHQKIRRLGEIMRSLGWRQTTSRAGANVRRVWAFDEM